MQPGKYHKAQAIVQRERAVEASDLLLLVPVKRYGSEGQEPINPADCPFYQQHGYGVSCISGSGGSLCSGFMGGLDGYTKCSLTPRQMHRGQRFVVWNEPEPHADPTRQHAPWN